MEEEGKEDSEPVMIDTSKKGSRPKKSANLPSVGQKRLRTSKKAMKDEESDAEVSGQPDEDSGSYDEEGSS